MSFLRFFWRDLKSDASYNWFTIMCASLGIIGLLMVESFKVGVEDKVTRNAKNFIAGDLSITTRKDFLPEEKNKIEDYLSTHHYPFASWIETYSLVRADATDGQTKMAQLNFVSPLFPFYGGLMLEGKGSRFAGEWAELHLEKIVYIARDLSWQLNLKEGDRIKIGEALFTVKGIITEDKFSSFRGLSLAPEIFISTRFLADTELIKYGSTASFSYSIKLPDDSAIEKSSKDLRKILPDRSVKIIGPYESSQQLSRALRILGDYLGLITLMTYLLSLTGLYYFTQHFLSLKLKTFSIYRSLGLSARTLFFINLAHLIFLITIAVLTSSIFVFVSLPALAKFFSTLSGEDIFFRLNTLSVLRILSLAVLGSLFSLTPLIWGALQTPVALVFSDLPYELKRVGKKYYIPLLGYIIVLALLISNSFKTGGLFLSSLLSILLLSALLFKFMTIPMEKWADKASFSLRHALKSLSRYFASSFTIFICLLLGMTLTTFILMLEGSLRREFTDTFGNKRPDLFMFDLQDSQYESFKALAQKNNWQITMLSPMIRARFLRINNEATQLPEPSKNDNFATREDEDNARMRNRGVNLSYRQKLSWSERIVEGSFDFSPCKKELKPCEISLEQGYAKRIGAKIGDTLYFDVSGEPVAGVVTNLRAVKWTSFEPNFFIIFQPGVLEDAPKTYLASFKVGSMEEKKEIFKEMADHFANVSIIEVSDILKKITTVFDLMAVAIKFIAFLSLFVSVVVLVAVSFNHLDLRKKEMGLFYLMGVSVGKIKKIYNTEISLIILMSLILSLVFGSLLTFVMMKFIFDSTVASPTMLIFSIVFILAAALMSIVAFRIHFMLKKKSFI